MGEPAPAPDQPCNITMKNAPGYVEMGFDPPIVRMRMKPREARTLAIGLFHHADSAEFPPPSIIEPLNSVPPPSQP